MTTSENPAKFCGLDPGELFYIKSISNQEHKYQSIIWLTSFCTFRNFTQNILMTTYLVIKLDHFYITKYVETGQSKCVASPMQVYLSFRLPRVDTTKQMWSMILAHCLRDLRLYLLMMFPLLWAQ